MQNAECRKGKAAFARARQSTGDFLAAAKVLARQDAGETVTLERLAPGVLRWIHQLKLRQEAKFVQRAD